MSTLRVGDITLNIGDFVIISTGNMLDYGWYCGQGRNTLQYYSVWSPGSALEDYEKFQAGDKTGWRAERFMKQGFTSKCFYKSYINSYYESRVLKVADSDNLFTNPKTLEKYKKSKEALIKIKFLQQ